MEITAKKTIKLTLEELKKMTNCKNETEVAKKLRVSRSLIWKMRKVGISEKTYKKYFGDIK